MKDLNTKGDIGYKAVNLIQMYKERAQFEQIETVDYLSGKKEDAHGLPFFNGQFARNCLRANAKEGWISIAALNDAGCFGAPVADYMYRTPDRKGMIVLKIEGEVVIIKTDEKGVPVKKLIRTANEKEIKQFTKGEKGN
jgi:hypothetical protein